MIYLFDSYYLENQVRTACVAINSWTATETSRQLTELSPLTSEYISGQFYKRELPGILQLLQQIELTTKDIIVLDSYVYLDDEHKKGLGAYLYDAIDQLCPVMGVAKKKFRTLDKAGREVLRGDSSKPLYVTAVGYDLDRAASHIRQMPGPYRIPDLLKLVDQLSKGLV